MYENYYYKNLVKPSYVPNGTVFKIVWPILYTLMFISLYFIIKSGGNKTFAISLFLIQLILNMLWSPVFFIFKNLKAALIINTFLIISVGIMFFVFYRFSHIAALLQIPYLLWLFFAEKLTFEIIKLNPDKI